MTLLPILDQSHKGWVLQIAKVPFKIRLKTSGLFLQEKKYSVLIQGELLQDKSQNLSEK
jgi:hypothetical protein